MFSSIEEIQHELNVKGENKSIVFDIPSMGELQFILPIIKELFKKHNNYLYYFAYRRLNDANKLQEHYPLFHKKTRHIPIDWLKKGMIKGIDLFITSEQYTLGINNVYSICIFHGQPSKGLTFTKEIIGSFDAFFLYGPLHFKAYEEYIAEHFINPPDHIQLFKVGYPKTDKLINMKLEKEEIINELGLDVNKKTILYAPAFNQFASLQEKGLEIISELSKTKKYNVIVKLPIDCYEYENNPQIFNNINWIDQIKELNMMEKNFVFYNKLEIEPVLFCSDLLVTCVSSISFEFLLLNKPVVFIDTPKFYSHYLSERLLFEPNIELLKEKVTVNGGKKFGIVVKEITKLGSVVDDVFSNYSKYVKDIVGIESYLQFNIGHASQHALNSIEEILNNGYKTKRTFDYSLYSFDFIELLYTESKINVALFGAGEAGLIVYNLIKNKNKHINISYFIDNDESKWWKTINGIQIRPSFDKYLNEVDKVIICSMYWRDIVKQLKKQGVDLSTVIIPRR